MQVMNRNGTTSELVSVGIFDNTSDAILTLYASLCSSASILIPSQTILLISNPGWRIDKTAKLSLNANSRVDINPDLGDARRLRALAQRMTKKQHVNPPFPIEPEALQAMIREFKTAHQRPLFSLAEVDTFARSNPTETIMGYLSLIITQLNLVTPCKRNMLMGNECCGIPIFANAVLAPCKQCGIEVPLRTNPRIVSTRPFVPQPSHLPKTLPHLFPSTVPPTPVNLFFSFFPFFFSSAPSSPKPAPSPRGKSSSPPPHGHSC